jgi:hypothetical protein
MSDFIAVFFAMVMTTMAGLLLSGGPETAPPAETAGYGRTAPAGGRPETNTGSGLVKCQIEVDGGPAYRSIVATATAADAPQAGTYTLDIEKTGPNTSRSSQHGDFRLASFETKRLATVRIRVGVSESLAGRLLLHSRGEDTVCEFR